MSAVLDPVAQRRARARAAAAAVLDRAPQIQRFQAATDILRPSLRRRAHNTKPVTPPPPRYFDVRRAAAVGALIIQCIALACALWLPTFRVNNINISGARMLSRAAVIATSGIDGASIFTVDGQTVQSRLLAMPWIRTASVSTQLPNKVNITITEWSPTLRMIHGTTDMLLADDGAIVRADVARPQALAAIPVLIDSRSGQWPTPAASFVQTLDQTATRLPAVLGVSVVAFQWQSNGLFSIWTSGGWEAILGHVDTADEIASIPDKLANLAALHVALNFVHPTFGYVDLENPQAPAVGGSPGIPSAITAAISAPLNTPMPAPSPTASATAATPTPAPTARPTPAPTPPPTATPYVFYLPPPPSH